MKNLIKNMKMRQKVMCIVIPTALMLVVLGVISLIFMQNINEASTVISENSLPSVIVAEELNTNSSDYRISELQHVVAQDEATMKEREATLETLKAAMEVFLEQYKNTLITNDKDEELILEVEKAWDQYIECSNEMITFSRENETQKATEILNGKSAEYFKEFSASCLELVEMNKTWADLASAEGDNMYQSAFSIMIVCLIFIIAVALSVGILIASNIVNPVKEIDAVARDIADEKLDQVITYKSKDELGALALNFNKIVGRLKTYIDYIDEISDALCTLAEGAQAQDTVALIDDTNKAVESGAGIVSVTANALETVVESIDEVTRRIESIVSSSENQARAMGEIENAVENISMVVQSNSSTAQETSATSEELNSQALILKNLVAQFELQ